jgi:anthranilate phosphoribosyltransferase
MRLALPLPQGLHHYNNAMNPFHQSDLQQSIQQMLREIALQMGQSLDELETERLFREASALLNHIAYEPLTLARVAGILLVYQIQDTEPAELEWFKSQLQQFSDAEEVEELVESIHRVDSL